MTTAVDHHPEPDVATTSPRSTWRPTP